MNKVPFFDYSRIFELDFPKYQESLMKTLRNSDFILRQEVDSLEEELASYFGVRNCISVANGADAIWISLLLAGVMPGDEVILPSHTYVATADAVKLIGAIPVVVDIDEDHSISPMEVLKAITMNTKAIIAVNLNGRCCNLDEILKISQEHNLVLIEDNAQGLGAKLKGRNSGTFGLFSTLSFFPAKILGCIGDGGAILTQSDDLAAKVRRFRNHGRNPNSYQVESWGVNSRLDNIQAAVLLAKMNFINENIERRREIASIYHSELQSISELLLPPAPNSSILHYDSFQNYEIEAEKRNELKAFLQGKGIDTILPWAGTPIHKIPLDGMRVMNVEKTEQVFSKILLLPMNQYLQNEEVHYVCKSVREFYGQ